MTTTNEKENTVATDILKTSGYIVNGIVPNMKQWYILDKYTSFIAANHYNDAPVTYWDWIQKAVDEINAAL